MQSLNKTMIDNAFRAFLIKTSACNGLSLYDMTLVIRIVTKNKILLQVCRKDIPETVIDLNTMLPQEMISLRFDAQCVNRIFLAVHYAFMQELKATDPLRISLVLYESSVTRCACIGIMLDEKAVKALMVSDILNAMELGNEQLN